MLILSQRSLNINPDTFTVSNVRRIYATSFICLTKGSRNTLSLFGLLKLRFRQLEYFALAVSTERFVMV